ncbi:biopolymer transporter ExbD [bacterium]|nr:biopolymer transporter ExbD [bacterium]HPF34200.1 biopolymer transporter ExbD [Candidatus Krumholzibacteria bacterium]HRX50023.1 biopolymer transporter ExbD [Candidatus Krumholzibacteria bacterium]
MKRTGMREENSANITPLADVTTTLIVVFLITMPAIMGNGIQVNATRAEASDTVVSTAAPEDEEELLMVSVTPEGIQVNGEDTPLADLSASLGEKLAARVEKTVVIVPSDYVTLGDVVDVMDAAKAGGAKSLALLNRKEGAQ